LIGKEFFLIWEEFLLLDYQKGYYFGKGTKLFQEGFGNWRNWERVLGTKPGRKEHFRNFLRQLLFIFWVGDFPKKLEEGRNQGVILTLFGIGWGIIRDFSFLTEFKGTQFFILIKGWI